MLTYSGSNQGGYFFNLLEGPTVSRQRPFCIQYNRSARFCQPSACRQIPARLTLRPCKGILSTCIHTGSKNRGRSSRGKRR